MRTFLAICTIILLSSCTQKTATYTFNQGAPDCDQPQVVARGISETPGNQTGAGSTNSGGAGNTIIIIEDTHQDSQATTDGAFSTSGAMAATGAIKDAVSKIVTDMRKTNSENPQTTSTTTTTNQTVKEELAEPEGLEDKPAIQPEGNVKEID